MKKRYKLLLAGASLAVGLCVGEGVVRIGAPQPPSWMPLFARHPAKPMFCVAPELDLAADTGESRWRVCSDANGLRVAGPGLEAERDAEVLVIGDSFTFGYGVNFEDSIPACIGELVEGDLRVVNAGQPAYGFQQYRLHLEHLLEIGFTPRGVLLTSFSGNDMYDALVDKDQPVRDGIIGNAGGAKGWIQRHSHLYRLAAKVYHSVWSKTDLFAHTTAELLRPDFWESPRGVRAFAACEAELRATAALCREHEVELCVVLLPPKAVVAHRRAETSECQEPGLDWGLPHEKFRTLLADVGVTCVDLTGALAERPTSETYFAFDGHLTPAGCELAARARCGSCSVLQR